jgi:hypothetical protein
VYRAVITELGETWLEEAGQTPTHLALAALVSPQLEAAHPRALFDAFCLRLGERFGAPQSTDACRILWRRLCSEGAILVRGSLQTDAGCAFALKEPILEGTRPRWSVKRDGVTAVSAKSEARTPSPRPDSAAPNMQDVPLIPQRVSDLFRDALARIVRVAGAHT